MGPSTNAIDQLDWPGITAQLDIEGYALLPGLLAPEQARDLACHTDTLKTLRRTSLASSDLGRGELFYFDSGLPAPWSAWRATFYWYLSPVANRWNETLGSGYRYPPELEEFLERNRQAGQTESQSHLNRLRVDDYLALHQRHDGEHVFPLQIVGLLTEPGSNFHGGEFVMTEQRPRMQTRPMVLPLRKGDAAIFAVNSRPMKGVRGDYQVKLNHGVSKLHSGKRHTLGVIFHDAA